MDDTQSVGVTETKWWIERLNLLDSDKEMISGAWLNVSIVSLVKQLYSVNFRSKSGFQNVVHGILMDFVIQTQCFIQILHDADRNHWGVFSNVESSELEEIYVYDSLFS